MKDESYPIHYILNDKRSIFYEIDPDLQTGVLQMASRELPPDSSYTELFRILCPALSRDAGLSPGPLSTEQNRPKMRLPSKGRLIFSPSSSTYKIPIKIPP